MKKAVLFLFSFLIFSQFSFAQNDTLRKVENNAFKVGEYLKYRIHYGIIDAGIAELRVMGMATKQGRKTYHIVGTGRTVGMAEWFFKTRDRYETYMDTEMMAPLEFVRDVNEGGFEINRHIIFNQQAHTAVDKEVSGKVFNIDAYAQDLISSFYYARTFNTNVLLLNQEVPIGMFLDHEMFDFQFKYIGKAVMKTEWGKVRCKKFQPLVQSGRVFEEKEGMTFWVTDDENKIPIRIESELAVGSIKIDLVDFKNTKHPIKFY